MRSDLVDRYSRRRGALAIKILTGFLLAIINCATLCEFMVKKRSSRLPVDKDGKKGIPKYGILSVMMHIRMYTYVRVPAAERPYKKYKKKKSKITLYVWFFAVFVVILSDDGFSFSSSQSFFFRHPRRIRSLLIS